MKLNVRYSNHPEDAKHYDTAAQRKHFLVEKIFTPGALELCYTHVDRVIFGGACPVAERLELTGGKELGTPGFLDRRELGIINVGGAGKVFVDGETWPLSRAEGLYVGMGAAGVGFESDDPEKPAKFYLASSPAHQTWPTVRIDRSKANPRNIGALETSNKRTIYQYVHPAVLKSCQLSMGMTILEPGCVWNTWMPHTHERRMEVYFYFDMADNTRVFHLHGRPDETRHIVVANEQAVISPSWSIHSGVGTGAYTFIWAMAGENQNFDDMDNLTPAEIR